VAFDMMFKILIYLFKFEGGAGSLDHLASSHHDHVLGPPFAISVDHPQANVPLQKPHPNVLINWIFVYRRFPAES
jgi:hypothetical protein